MDPLLDYYLCVRDGETELVAAYGSDSGTLACYDSVQELTYWQAVQLTYALWELERSTAQGLDLFPLAAFMGADERLINALFADGVPG